MKYENRATKYVTNKTKTFLTIFERFSTKKKESRKARCFAPIFSFLVFSLSFFCPMTLVNDIMMFNSL